MSASPDFMTQLMASLQGGQGNSYYNPLIGLAAGLLQAGGPSRMPTSLGQALGQGLQGAQQFQQAGLQNQLQQLMLGRTKAQLGLMQDALNGGDTSQQPSQAPSAPLTGNGATDTNSLAAGMGLSVNPINGQAVQGGGPNALNLTPQMPQQTTQNMPYQPQQGPKITAAQPAPTATDPYQDATYLKNIKLAQVMDMMQPGTGAGYSAAASQRIDYLTKERAGLWQTVPPSQYASLGLPAQQPGVTWQRNTQTGEVVPKGESTIKDVQYMDPNTGMPVHQLYDTAAGKYVGPNPSPTRTPNTPLPGPLESNAQGLADYTMDLDKINARGMTGAILKARAKEINPEWDETTYKAKQGLAEDFAKGANGKALVAFNTATSHLDTMAQAADALNNGNTQIANRITNAFGVQLGQNPVTNFNTVKQLVAGEVAKAIAGGNVAEGDREKANAVLNSVNSPAQLQGAIQQIRNLMGGKLAALKTSYESMGLPNFERKLTPAALQAMQTFEGQNQTQAAPTGNKVLTYDPSTGTFH